MIRGLYMSAQGEKTYGKRCFLFWWDIMVTIKDIANKVGVSATTVSNVIHGYNARVSKDMAEKIQSAIKEMGYVPNMSARSLVSRSSHVIALINYTDLQDPEYLIRDPFHLLGIAMIEAKLRESGYYMMLRSCRTSEELSTFLQNWNVDGLFITGYAGEEFLSALKMSGKPVIMIDGPAHEEEISVVGQDDYQGGYLTGSYLIEKGHTRIGYATPFLHQRSLYTARFEGFCDALSDAGLSFDRSLLFEHAAVTVDDCLEIAKEVRKNLHSGMTALNIASDHLAIVVLNDLIRNGVKLPSELSIIGFGNLVQGRICMPTLTTVYYDAQEKAQLAVQYMLEMLSGERTEQVHTVLPVKIIERESVCQATAS